MTKDVKLLVRADDAGASWSGTMGCHLACRDGIARSVEVMMPGAWVALAADLLNPLAHVDVGVHLTLSSEWDAIRWRPLTTAPSLVGADGYFHPLVLTRIGDTRKSLQAQPWELAEIEAEFRAQIEHGLQMFERVTHVSGHMIIDFAQLAPEVGALVEGLAQEYGLLNDPLGRTVSEFSGYAREPFDPVMRRQSFVKRLRGLSPGVHGFVDHPAVANEELSALGNSRAVSVAEDRTSCLAVMTDPLLRDEIAALGIEVIGYGDLVRQ